MLEKNKYLVAIDLDGTLLKDDKTISKESINYLHKFEKEGNVVVITSGRAPRSVIKYRNILGVFGPFSSYNGTYAFFENDIPAIEYKLDKDFVKDLYKKVIHKEVYSVMAENLNTIYYDLENKDLKLFFEPIGMKVIEGDIDKILDDDPYVFIMQLNEPLKENQDKLREIFKSIPDYEIRFWNESSFAEIYQKGVSKASTLEKIVEFCKVNKENVLVFGDAENDVELLESFENSFFMCNGYKALAKHAKYITKKDNNHNGVISSIQEFIKSK